MNHLLDKSHLTRDLDLQLFWAHYYDLNVNGIAPVFKGSEQTISCPVLESVNRWKLKYLTSRISNIFSPQVTREWNLDKNCLQH